MRTQKSRLSSAVSFAALAFRSQVRARSKAAEARRLRRENRRLQREVDAARDLLSTSRQETALAKSDIAVLQQHVAMFEKVRAYWQAHYEANTATEVARKVMATDRMMRELPEQPIL